MRFQREVLKLHTMILTAVVKLSPTSEQRQLLYQTLAQANQACNAISDRAWKDRIFRQFDLHQLSYRYARGEFGLAAQLAIRCVAKVADAYKADRKTKRQFKKLGTVAYDSRILNFRMSDQTVSIWLLGGRQVMPFLCGQRQAELLRYQKGESDLVYRKGEYYLYAACDLPDAVTIDPQGWLGIDLGIVNIAVDSDGDVCRASHINNVRHRHQRLRSKLQRKGTKAAKRRLRRLSGQESRFARDTNHCISKRIVRKAYDTQRAIALEDLTGITLRVTVTRSRRRTLHSWSFDQLRQFILYKATRRGVPWELVDPKNTSRTCPACGYVDKKNRLRQDLFLCLQCGCAGLADHFAAVTISRRAAVNRPYVSDTQACLPALAGAA